MADPSSSIECDEGSRFLEAANETLPELLVSADGGVQEWTDYIEQVAHSPKTNTTTILSEPAGIGCMREDRGRATATMDMRVTPNVFV